MQETSESGQMEGQKVHNSCFGNADEKLFNDLSFITITNFKN